VRHCNPIGDVEMMSRHVNTGSLDQLGRPYHSSFVDIRECEITSATR